MWELEGSEGSGKGLCFVLDGKGQEERENLMVQETAWLTDQ